MSPETDAAYRAALKASLQAAADVLERGGTSVDAIEAAIRLMEDNPLFNAGKGAVFTADGKNELDSALMDGATMNAGAVAGVTRTRNPISLARAVMEKSPHVMLIGSGADQFAASVKLEQVDPSYFFTERRWQSLIRQLKKEGAPLPQRPQGAPPAPAGGLAEIEYRCGNFDRRDPGEAMGKGRRFADYRGGNLRVEPVLCRIGDRDGRVLYPAYGRPHNLLAGSVQGNEASGSG
jgi:beta-aspartyl-peptidase (threonine type)